MVWPTLPLIPALAILVASVAAIAAPPPLRPAKRPSPTATGSRVRAAEREPTVTEPVQVPA
jgi:hypothetical protein